MRLVLALILLIFVCCLVGCSGVAYRLPGMNMAPTITPDDMAVVNPVHYTFNDVERFDIVVFEAPEEIKLISREPGMRLMMRVIGLPGEVVELSDGEVLINGKKLIQDFDVTIEKKNFGPITVEQNQCFLLGDNRPESLDSRQWKDPTIERSQIYSKVVQIKKGFYNGN